MKNHFILMIAFSVLTSLVLAFITKDNSKERFKYFLYLFCAFIGFSILVGWLAYPFPF
jgi:heme A synthase